MTGQRHCRMPPYATTGRHWQPKSCAPDQNLQLEIGYVWAPGSLIAHFQVQLFFKKQKFDRNSSREHLRRVLRKKTSAELRIIYIFKSSPLHIHILTYLCSSSHLHTYILAHLLICASTSLLIFTSSHRHLCSSSSSHIYISAHVHIGTSTSLLIFTSSHLHLTSSPLALLYFLS